jgi:hypothetical protein
MVFPANHPKYPGQVKGMTQVLEERGLLRPRLLMQCPAPKKCEHSATACCAKHILELQSDFLEQCSLVQEVIEATGHLCILPKFHCELNFIQFFWGAVKKYLRDNCDYTFVTLKKNLPNALASVQLSTIRKWEHHMVQWMDVYCLGLGAKDAQLQVRAGSSRKTYTSHRRVNLTVARTFDQ